MTWTWFLSCRHHSESEITNQRVLWSKTNSLVIQDDETFSIYTDYLMYD